VNVPEQPTPTPDELSTPTPELAPVQDTAVVPEPELPVEEQAQAVDPRAEGVGGSLLVRFAPGVTP
jgi:hypothetical protein